MLAIVCPGQGSQSPGFLTPWLDLPEFRARMAWLSACAGMDLIHYGTEADAGTIKDTAIAQPLIVGSGLVSLLALFEHPVEGFRSVGVGAGHSVGEITAAAAAGVLTAEQAMVFVRERGAGMADASAITPTGMAAVVGGGEPGEVVAHLESLGLAPANMNGAGQIVAAGTLDQIETLRNDPPAKARVIPLQVAGAFHTTHMAPAVERLSVFARAITTHSPRIPLVSNKDGLVVHDGSKALARLVSQVSNPVRWDLTMETFKAMGVTGLIEIPPAGTLTNLAKRALPGVETLALKSPDDLDAAQRMVREHGVVDTDFAPAWRLVIAPAKGTIQRAPLAEGDTITPGETIGQVVTARDAYNVVAPHGGRIIEWLVSEDDPVSPGQPLVRLHPKENA